MFYIIYCFNKNKEYKLSMTKTLEKNKIKIEKIIHKKSERIFEIQNE